MFLGAELHVAVAGKLLLCLAHKCVETSLDVRQAFANVGHERGVQCLGQELRSAAVGDIPVGRVMFEEILLGLNSFVHRFPPLDVLLRAIHCTNEAQLQGVDATRKDVQSVRAMIHKINLGEHTNGTSAQGIDMAGKFQGLGIDKVNVGGGDSQNDTVRLGDIFGYQGSGLLLDIGGLVTNGYLEGSVEVI